jgi:D-alanyl-D-alanine carboxypeptidase
MKIGLMRRQILAAVALILLLPACWVGYVSYLTAYEDRACGETVSLVRESDNTENEELQSVLDNYSAKGRAGLQTTVVFPDGAVWSGTSGYASREKECELTLNHHLYIGSITKLYTASLVMVQVEKGTISLDDTLDEWVDFPYANTITVRMLLNHTSGIPSYTDDIWFLIRYFGFPRKQWQSDDLVRLIRSKNLKFEPGSRHEYSNSNYLLLGVVLDKVTSKSYQVLLKEMVVDNLALRNTYFLTYPHDLAIANGYDESILHLGTRNLTGFRRSFETGAFSAGGILATSEDVAIFIHSLFAGKIVADAALAQMETFVDAPDDDVPLQKGYGLGLRNLVIGEEDLVGHTGTIPGYSGIAMHNKAKHYTIVILGNLSVIEQTQLLAEVQNVVSREQVP